MSEFLYHAGASAACTHRGEVQVKSGNPRVLVDGQPVATMADTFPISGCTFTLPSGKAQPCAIVQWMEPATRVTAEGKPVILKKSEGQCFSIEQIPQGPPSVTVTQTRVRGE